ncbi:Checkpoint protein kinase [Spraguea lophii 42_110]|uniref:Checkpoint protein kinase n=1 Tax=Spraguea lophii (strain 42_110) TaxID=1358809 RepID=S7XM09_SPRLO|nr:Checkpoint protein kinase [Spraguea lophii 42_110]
MDDFKFIRTISVGATATVKKAKYKSGNTYAIKIVNLDRETELLKKEIKLHKYLSQGKIEEDKILEKNIHILKLYSFFQNNLVLEYAPYDLCSIVTPYLGVKDAEILHFYFIQLISAVEFLHSKNICHRDIKPENILITANGVLKLADFGQSTLFIHNKKYRRLTTPAGSIPYMAPEIANSKKYRGDQIDIWSIGILLIVLSTGTYPWKIAQTKDKDYKTFCSLKYHNYTPFTRINQNMLSLIEQILQYNPDKRLTIKNIKNSKYYNNSTNKFIKNNKIVNNDVLMYNLKNYTKIEIKPFSQPIQIINQDDKLGHKKVKSKLTNIFYSHPTDITRRVYLHDNLELISSNIEHILSSLKISSTIKNIEEDTLVHRFVTIDSNRNTLEGSIIIQQLNEKAYIQFQRMKGDGIEFKILSNVLVEKLKDIFY